MVYYLLDVDAKSHRSEEIVHFVSAGAVRVDVVWMDDTVRVLVGVVNRLFSIDSMQSLVEVAGSLIHQSSLIASPLILVHKRKFLVLLLRESDRVEALIDELLPPGESGRR